MIRVGEHFVPTGPLAVRWLGYRIGRLCAGEPTVVRVALENAGSARWASAADGGVLLAYHWLDERGNAIVWDGLRTPLPRVVAPRETLELDLRVLSPRPPGRYVLALDLLEEHHFWFEEVGNVGLTIPLDVGPRIGDRRLGVVVHGRRDSSTEEALRAQLEPVVSSDPAATAHLVAGARPAPEWSRVVLDAHAEGFAAVGVALVSERRSRKLLAAWGAGSGRNPRPAMPLLMPSLLPGFDLQHHLGLPAYSGPEGVFDGRVGIALDYRAAVEAAAA